LAKSPEEALKPAVRRADAEAGITPPFAAIAMKFRRPPAATTHMNRMSRFRRMQAATRP
jgi:hypothetical protein